MDNKNIIKLKYKKKEVKVKANVKVTSILNSIFKKRATRVKRKLIIVMILFLMLFSVILANVTYARNPDVRALGAVIIDAESGNVLWGKNEKDIRAIASLTKIMTAIIALENGNLDDEYEVSSYAASMPETKLFVKEGEKYKLQDLLYALMLKSANDVAVVIAEGTSGSVLSFADLMNKKAKEIGCLNTNFVTPNGLDNGSISHHSTAFDIGMIARYALNNDEFKKIIMTKDREITEITSGRKLYVSNSNRLLGQGNVKGIKTGFTNLAGQCFAGYFDDGDKKFITVALASGWGKRGKEAKWKDTINMMSYVNQNMIKKVLVRKGDKVIRNVLINNSYNMKVNLYAKDDCTSIMPNKKIINAKANVYLYEDLKAPINKGRVVAVADILVDDKKISEVYLYVSKEIIDRSFKNSFIYILKFIKIYFFVNNNCL